MIGGKRLSMESIRNIHQHHFNIEERYEKVIKRIFLGVFALVIFALGAGIIPSYYSLEVSDYEFENEKIQESVKLVQLSDIHNAEFGKENQRLLKKLKECEPDLIFITGDLINSDENEISPMLDLIKNYGRLHQSIFPWETMR